MIFDGILDWFMYVGLVHGTEYKLPRTRFIPQSEDIQDAYMFGFEMSRVGRLKLDEV